MTETTYNGWTNYATWRVNLEMFEGAEYDSGVSPEYLQEFEEECIGQEGESIAIDYALAFISDVNWYEIAEHINEEIEEE
jgi:hypothetical protein